MDKVWRRKEREKKTRMRLREYSSVCSTFMTIDLLWFDLLTGTNNKKKKMLACWCSFIWQCDPFQHNVGAGAAFRHNMRFFICRVFLQSSFSTLPLRIDCTDIIAIAGHISDPNFALNSWKTNRYSCQKVIYPKPLGLCSPFLPVCILSCWLAGWLRSPLKYLLWSNHNHSPSWTNSTSNE